MMGIRSACNVIFYGPGEALATSGAATGGVKVPFAWIDEKAPGLLANAYGDHDAAAQTLAANGVNTVADCYVAGLEPENPDSVFRADIRLVNGRAVVGPYSDSGDGPLPGRVYRVLGATSPDPAAQWDDVTDLDNLDATPYRFFKAAVSLE